MPFIAPGSYSRADLDSAGARLSHGLGTPADLRMLDNWRGSHLYVINSFQSTLRARRKRSTSTRSVCPSRCAIS